MKPFNETIHTYLLSLGYEYEHIESNGDDTPEHDWYTLGNHAVVVIGNLSQQEWERARKKTTVVSSGTPILQTFHTWLLAKNFEHEKAGKRTDMYYSDKNIIIVYYPEDFQ